MPLSPFFYSGLLMFVPYYQAAICDVQSRVVPIKTWLWALFALPTSIYGYYTWWLSGQIDYNILVLVVVLLAVFFLGSIIWTDENVFIGGGDILAIIIMLVFVPILPELTMSMYYIYPLLLCTAFLTLGWNVYGKTIPFLLPFTLSHAVLILVSSIRGNLIYTHYLI